MAASDALPNPPPQPESRWQAFASSLAAGGLSLALPPSWVPGPPWIVMALVIPLLGAAWLTHRAGRHRLNDLIGTASTGVLTLGLVFALSGLIATLPTHKENALELLRSAGALWPSNILIFAHWYWRLDAGGPNARHMRGDHEEGAFLFPQMTLEGGTVDWRPDFIDYLFLAFNTSTAFSPTDTAPLSRWAKSMMMIQSLISLCTIAVLFGRAVNIL